MSILFREVASLVIAVSVAGACAGGPALPTAGGTPAPGSAGGSGVGSGTECANYPAFRPTASVQPSLPVDPSLLSQFPQQVAGQPITGASAVPFLPFVCTFAGQAAFDQVRGRSSVLGVDLSNMSFGEFKANVDGSIVTVSALRTPGQDASKLVSNVGLFAGFAGITVSSAFTAANLGGKNIMVTTDGSGNRTSFYAHGDTLFILDKATDTQAAAILQALP